MLSGVCGLEVLWLHVVVGKSVVRFVESSQVIIVSVVDVGVCVALGNCLLRSTGPRTPFPIS